MSRQGETQRLRMPLRGLCRWLHRSDKGSGTVAGIALVMMAATLTSAMAGAGHMAICQARARSAADLAAFSAALAWHGSRHDPCSLAGNVVSENGARMVSCALEGGYMGDVTVSAAVRVSIPMVPEVIASACAGPSACD